MCRQTHFPRNFRSLRFRFGDKDLPCRLRSVDGTHANIIYSMIYVLFYFIIQETHGISVTSAEEPVDLQNIFGYNIDASLVHGSTGSRWNAKQLGWSLKAHKMRSTERSTCRQESRELTRKFSSPGCREDKSEKRRRWSPLSLFLEL